MKKEIPYYGSIINLNKDKMPVSVNARELREFLGSQQQFTNLIEKRIRRHGFAEDEGFTSFDKIIKGDSKG